MVSVAGTISSLSEENALTLFKAIALSGNDYSSILITKLGLTRRQYYSIMKKLMDADLVKRISGKYSLTSFGKIVFTMHIKIESAIKYYWKLKAIDSIIMSATAGLPTEEYQRIVDTLIDNEEIKNLIISNKSINNKFESHISYRSTGELEKHQEQRRHTIHLKEILTH